MSVAVIGVNHKNCPVEIREKVSFMPSKIPIYLRYFKALGVGVVILSTCNRSEIYIEDENIEEAVEKVVSFYKHIYNYQYIGDDIGDGSAITPYLWVAYEEQAIKHLFEVAVGLDSIVIGEDQILGQVKQAYNMAFKEKATGKVTHKIFCEAITTAKRVKSALKISEHPLSISHIAIEFLKEKQGTLKGKKALIIGLGQINRVTIKYLIEEQLETIYVTQRKHSNHEEKVLWDERFIPIDYKERYEILRKVDFVISATASPHVVLERDKMPLLTKRLDIMDIAMPRDVEEAINSLPYAFVYHIDQLKEIAQSNYALREKLSHQAEEMIGKSLEKLLKWREGLDLQEVIQGLDSYCEVVKNHTSKYISRKIEGEMNTETIEWIIDETLKRCMRTPIAQLMATSKMVERDDYVRAINELFQMEKQKIK